MNKELFVSSTPHETKVGLVEDDLLAEIYLERENEYTLAGSIYKGRVTRVLPGMQSAFVDIGLERDAFLYVSDFMELEEHDEDLTDVVPANRGVQDMRHPAPAESAPNEPGQGAEAGGTTAFEHAPSRDFNESNESEESAEGQPALTAGAAPEGGFGQDRERGGLRGRRRRRGGRRDGRSEGRGDGRSEGRTDGRGEGRDRGSETRSARPAEPAPPVAAPVFAPPPVHRTAERAPQFGPPAGYQPILLPGESISKYRGLTPTPAVQEQRPQYRETEKKSGSQVSAEPSAPVAATFPDDEPIFSEPIFAEPIFDEPADVQSPVDSVSASAAAVPVVEMPPQERYDSIHAQDDHAASAAVASTTVDWNREFRRAEIEDAPAVRETAGVTEESVEEEEFVEEDDEMVDPGAFGTVDLSSSGAARPGICSSGHARRRDHRRRRSGRHPLSGIVR